MIKQFLNLHSYLIVNGAMMVTYLLARLVHTFPWINQRLSQLQKLKFARSCLMLGIITFLLMQYIIIIHPTQEYNFEFQPALYQASKIISASQAVVATQLANTAHMPLRLPLKTILIFFWLAGTVMFLVKYLQTIALLKKTQQQSFCQHNINNTQILFSPSNDAPFCWSSFNKHFITLPNMLLEQHEDKRLAIRHELQHIRQGDTYWLHFMTVLHLFCYWNPFVKLWMNWLGELQEFACDEEIILRRTASPSSYAQCLVNAASHTVNSSLLSNGVISINGMSKSMLYRRVNMLFTYKKPKRKLALIAAYTLSFCAITSVAFALNDVSNGSGVSMRQLNEVIQNENLQNTFKIAATPEVVAEINRIRHSEKARESIIGGLERMKQYQPIIQAQLKNNSMPTDLLAMPLMQTRYQPLDASHNHVSAAGIWQIIPSTAINLGLVVNPQHDDRLDTELSTRAALTYLNNLHNEFHDWKLAVVAYEIGEKNTEKLIKSTGSRDAWTIARAPSAPKELRDYLAMFDAAVVIIHKPDLITG